MSDINIKRFVNINIVYHEKSAVSSIRDTVVLLSTEGNATETKGPYASIDAFTEDFPKASTDAWPITRAYAETYFKNNGNKLLVITKAGSQAAGLKTLIAGLKNEYIVVAYASSDNYALIKGIAQDRANDATIYGINQKILLARNTVATDTDKVANFAAKVSSELGAEMTIAAYLSNIDFDGVNTVLDYMYTKESIEPEASDDALLGNVLENFFNVVMKVAMTNVNLGGNLKDGKDLVNQYTLIVLQQTLTDSIMALLLSKIKGSAGISAIQSVVAKEMNRYLTNGYLTTDKIWKDETLTTSYNGQTFKIIEKNEPLLLGYKFVTLPLASLTDADILARKTPPMYLIVADSYGIRTVTINGEVI